MNTSKPDSIHRPVGFTPEAAGVLRRALVPQDSWFADRLTDEESARIAKATSAYKSNGHFVYRDGSHGSVYLDVRELYHYPEIATLLCDRLAIFFRDRGVDTIVAPSDRDLVLGLSVARTLSETGRNVAACSALRDGPLYTLSQAALLHVRDRDVGILFDVVTTGEAALRIITDVGSVGGRVVALGALWNRGFLFRDTLGLRREQTKAIVEFISLPGNHGACDLCVRGVPINTEFGHGAEFLAARERT